MPARLAAVCCLLLISASCSGQAPATSGTRSSPSSVPLEIKSYDQIQDAIRAQQGKVVVVDCWSTSCEPCLKEFPGLVALHRKYGEKVACMSVSVDYEGIGKPEEQRARVLEFLTQQGATFPNFLASEDSEVMFKKLQIPSIPAVFVYDRSGKLHKKTSGDFKYADVEPMVAELLK